MSDIEPRNSLAWRVGQLERQVERLEGGQSGVLAERVSRLSRDIVDLRKDVNEDMGRQANELKSFKRMFAGAFTGLGLTVAGAVIALILSGGPP